MEYGSKQWFEYMFSGAAKGEDLWGHQWRAIQKYRYLLTLSMVSDRVTACDHQRILDLGCGLGDFTAMLHALNPKNEVYGTDFVERAVVTAQQKYPAIHFKVAALPDIEVPGTFNGIVALESLYYLEPAERRQAMRNIATKLVENGWFLFSGHLGRGGSDVHYFSENDVRAYMQEAGFRIEKTAYNYAALYSKFEGPLLTIVNMPVKIDALCRNRDALARGEATIVKVVTTPVLGPGLLLFIRGCAVACKGVLRFMQPVALIRFFQWLSRRLLGDKGKSHIIVLGLKES